MKTPYFLFYLASVMLLTNVATANDINVGKKKPSATQVIDALSPETNAEGTDIPKNIPKDASTRSIGVIYTDAPSKPKAKQTLKTNLPPSAHKASTENALSMEILFAYKSAQLTAAAKENLQPVGEALASEKLQNLSFIVEGHTDAVGGEAYNQSLSEERAASVKQFLVDTFHIDTTRVKIIGKGKSELLDPSKPDSEVNRRVRIVAKK